MTAAMVSTPMPMPVNVLRQKPSAGATGYADPKWDHEW